MRSDEKVSVIGIDIVKSGGSNLANYIYAIAIYKEGSVRKIDEGGFGRLVRLIWENRPVILAVDNLLELGGTKRNLIKFLRLIPPDTEIVQVNLEGKKALPLKSIAIKAGLNVDKGKLNPVKTAIALAVLASQGYGEKLTVFEKKVKINVYVGRHGFAGGSRSDKYRRSMRSAVAQMVKKLKEELDKRGIDYDVTIRRSKGGIERALFVVYASREDLFGVIRKARGRDVVVKIRPVINRKLLKLTEQERPARYLIVGYDPGIEAGLAVIDLDKKPVIIMSGRELDRGEIASKITNFGVPVIVATDKNPPPEMVRKLAAMLGTQLYVPPRSLGTGEKELIASEYCKSFGVSVKNTHERDALSAALKAYRTYEEKLMKLTEKIRKMGLSTANIQKYKVRLIANEPLSSIIEDIINDSVKEKTPQETHLSREPQQRSMETEFLKEEIAELKRRLDIAYKERDLYKARVKELEKQVSFLLGELSKITGEINEKVVKDRKVSELLHRLRNITQYVQKIEFEKSRVEAALHSIGKVIERVFAGELILVPKLGAKCVLKDADQAKVLYVDNVMGISNEVIGRIESEEKALVLPPGSDTFREYLVNERMIPASVAKEVWVISECLRAVDADSVKEADRIMNVIKERKRALEKPKEFTYADLEALLMEYRSIRLSSLSGSEMEGKD